MHSCLQGYFGHQMETSLPIARFRFIGKQDVVKVPEGGPRYDTVGLIVNVFMTNHSLLIYIHCVWYELRFILLNLPTSCIVSQLFHLPEFLLTDFHAEC